VLVPRARRHEVRERLHHDGRIETPLDLTQVCEAARALRAAGARSIAVCFFYCYVDPHHEQTARRVVEEECPEAFVTCSHEVASEFRKYGRLSTVVVNAYLGSVLAGYLAREPRSMTSFRS
jgi:N-methylhydantoinase A